MIPALVLLCFALGCGVRLYRWAISRDPRVLRERDHLHTMGRISARLRADGVPSLPSYRPAVHDAPLTMIFESTEGTE